MKKLLLTCATALAALCSTSALAAVAGEEVDLGVSVNWSSADFEATDAQTVGQKYAYAVLYSIDYSGQFWNYPFFGMSLPDGTISGNPTYDVAAKKSNGYWRIPTQAEWDELAQNCTIESDGSGIKLTSKTNGNSIYIPGERYRTGDNNGTMAIVMYASSYGFSDQAQEPYMGFPIRPVHDKSGTQLEKILLSADRSAAYAGTKVQVTAVADPEDVALNVKYSSSDESIATIDANGLVSTVYGKSGKVTITATQGDVTASLTITVTAVTTDPSETVVDLGLGVKWCASNLGASSPTEIGTTYPFAYIEQADFQTAYDGYKYSKGAGTYSFPTDNFCGNKEYDAVAVAYAAGTYAGERLPSVSECEDLAYNCDATLIDNSTFRIVSRINGKAITIPAKSVYTGSTNTWKTAAYLLSLNATNGVKVTTASSPFTSLPLRGVVDLVTKVNPEAINVTPATASVYPENSTTLKFSVYPANADIEDLTWSSSDESVATVAQNGTVTGVSDGTVTISATAGGVTGSATITVNPFNLTQEETVDMGTGRPWATCEVGATEPGTPGDIFYFGMVTPRPNNTINEADWVKPGVNPIAGTEYDPATAILGKSFQMPGFSELYGLVTKCTIEWVIYKGRYGALLTSPTTGGRIFCPLHTGTKNIFKSVNYMCDNLVKTYGSSGEGVAVEGVTINSRAYAMDTSFDPWTPLPILPVYVGVGTGIDNTIATQAPVNDIYTIGGQRLDPASQLAPGLYISRKADGTASKFIVK